MAVNKTDITVRLQRLGCCIADKTYNLSRHLQNGSDDINCEFNRLRTLLGYADVLKSYQTILDEEPAYILYDINQWSYNSTGNFDLELTVFYNDDVYLYNVAGQVDIDTAFDNLVTVINSTNNPAFTAEYDSTTHIFKITAPEGYGDSPNDTWYAQFGKLEISGAVLDIPASDTDTTYFDYGVNERTEDDLDNCVTEEELMNIFEEITKICKICFQPLNFNYKEDIDLTDTRVTEAGEERIDESGETRIIE